MKVVKEKCFFCPGNEHLTPPEIGRIVKNHGWQMRWFENKFAALKPEGEPAPKIKNRFFTSAASYGKHEVIVETPHHEKQLAELPIEEVEQVMRVYAQRILELEKIPHVKYVNIFKNHGPKGGTSLVHSHSQVMAMAKLPSSVMEKVMATRKFVECPYCKVIEVEKKSERRCFENEEFVAFCPYASRFNFEIWIFPKKHLTRLEQVNFRKLAEILSKVLRKIHELSVSYNMILHYAPRETNLHFHIEICPRIATWAGFELGTNIVINSVAPEDAARYYRR